MKTCSLRIAVQYGLRATTLAVSVLLFVVCIGCGHQAAPSGNGGNSALSGESADLNLVDANVPDHVWSDSKGMVPRNGFVPDADIAKAVAQAVLSGMFGSNTISAQLPLNAKLVREIWKVTGTLPAGNRGGVAEIRINRLSGCIEYANHSR